MHGDLCGARNQLWSNGLGGAKIDRVGHCRYWADYYHNVAVKKDNAVVGLQVTPKVRTKETATGERWDEVVWQDHRRLKRQTGMLDSALGIQVGEQDRRVALSWTLRDVLRCSLNRLSNGRGKSIHGGGLAAWLNEKQRFGVKRSRSESASPL